MKGDFSRDTFNRMKRYSGVLMQQGRVQLDADWNEQLSIQLYRTHTEAVDVIGQCGVPRGAAGFRVEPLGADDLRLSAGRLYVGGLLCEVEDGRAFTAVRVAAQPNRMRIGSATARTNQFGVGRWIEVSAVGRASVVRRITSVNASGVILTLNQTLASFDEEARLLVRAIATYTTQPDNPAPTHTTDAPAGSPPTGSPPAGSPPEGDAADLRLDLANGLYLAYLHAWQQHITALDDPQIREKALGGPDTATRMRNVWQVNLLPVASPASPPDCATEFAEWTSLTAAPDGLMNARVRPVEDDEDPCTLPPQAGYRRLENQLYRVEIHRGGSRDEATFKWSRENASVQTSIVDIDDDTVTVSHLHEDDVLGFKSENWVEVVDDESELTLPGSTPRALLRVAVRPDTAQREITLSGSVEHLEGRRGLKLRRWDQSGDGLENGIPLNSADAAAEDPQWVQLEGGIQVRFSGNQFQAGDYWLIPARTATGMIEWPPFDAEGTQAPEPQPPRGIKHHYCRLALLTVAGGVIRARDCRDIFPPLTDITAEDVSFDNTACLPELEGVTNVQEAIEHLCHSHQGACTFVVVPVEGWERVFDRVGAGRDAEICFQAGEFPLAVPVRVEGKGHLKLTGAGRGTRILARRAEATLAFDTCASVTIRDIYAETGATGAGEEGMSDLNGTLTFLNCGAVDVESVALRCGAGTARASACVTVRNNPERPRPARVRGCELEVGHRQQGILLINVERAQVEDNVVRVYEKPARLRLENLVRDERGRAALRRILISGASLAAEPPGGGKTNVTLRSGDAAVHFKAHNSVRTEWQQLLRDNPPGRRATSARGLLTHARTLADRILIEPAFRARFTRFNLLFESLRRQDTAVAAQGITVGGRTAREVRVLNNTVEGVLEGVHVGLSIRPGEQDIAGTILIAGNRVTVVLPPDAGREDRYGIFVGNCDSLVVENNNVRLQRLDEATQIEIDGIRVWGALGECVMVRQNYVASIGDDRESTDDRQTSFDIGIRVNPLNPARPVKQWVVMWNVAPSKRLTVSAPASVTKLNNVP